MQENLQSAISQLAGDASLSVRDEAATKQGVVLRLLSLLGWDNFDINEVRPEYPVQGGKVDYALVLTDSPEVFIEVKRPGEDLDRHQEQLLNYSFREGVKLAVLTTGLTWWFYLPLQKGSWEQRRFYAIDLSQRDPHSAARRLEDFLSKEKVSSGMAMKNAETVYEDRRKGQIVEQSLPQAWNRIVSEPDDLLVELIGETAESISGFRPDPEAIDRFLARHGHQLVVATSESRSLPSDQVLAEAPTVASKQPGRFVGRSIRSFVFRGERFDVRTWKDLLVTLAEAIRSQRRQDFDRVLDIRGTKRQYFSRDHNQLREPRELGGSGIFVETHWSADGTVKMCGKLLALFGYSADELRIEAA